MRFGAGLAVTALTLVTAYMSYGVHKVAAVANSADGYKTLAQRLFR
jgi:hypothetical protein